MKETIKKKTNRQATEKEKNIHNTSDKRLVSRISNKLQDFLRTYLCKHHSKMLEPKHAAPPSRCLRSVASQGSLPCKISRIRMPSTCALYFRTHSGLENEPLSGSPRPCLPWASHLPIQVQLHLSHSAPSIPSEDKADKSTC